MAPEGRKRDFLYIAVAVGAVFGLLFAYSGVWPPIVMVETESMMHVQRFEYLSGLGAARADGVGFGRLGTMDPGDIVLVKGVDRVEDVSLFVNADDDHYGRPGDVVAYKRPGQPGEPPIIHRAMTYVSVSGAGDRVQYRVMWTEAWEERGDCVHNPVYVCEFGAEGVSIPEIGIRDKQWAISGFITKGDNVVSNAGADQAGAEPLMPQPVTIDQVVGKAQLEVPALGLIRLAFSGDTITNAQSQGHPYFLRIGNVVAPVDLWSVVLFELVLLAAAPFAVTMVREFASKPDRRLTGELSVLVSAWEEQERLRAAAARKQAERRAAAERAHAQARAGARAQDPAAGRSDERGGSPPTGRGRTGTNGP